MLTELVAASGADAEPVDADVIEGDETGTGTTAELAERIGWDAKTLGKALRQLEIPTRQ